MRNRARPLTRIARVLAPALVSIATLSVAPVPVRADEVTDFYVKSNAALQAGKLEEGAAFMKQAYDKAVETGHPQTDVLGLNAGVLLNRLEKWDDAISVLEPTLDRYKAKHGADSEELVPVLDQLQAAYVQTRNTDGGIALSDVRIAIATKKHGADSDEVKEEQLNRLVAVAFGGDFKGASRQIRLMLRDLEEAGRERSVPAAQGWLRLATIQLANPEPGLSTLELTDKYTRRGEEILEEVLPLGHPKLIEHYEARLRVLERAAGQFLPAERDKREVEEKLAKNRAAAEKGAGTAEE